MESTEFDRPVDELVDQLLRDKDFLLAREIRHKTEELNQLFVQAQRQKLKIELDQSEFAVQGKDKITYLDIRVFKQI